MRASFLSLALIFLFCGNSYAQLNVTTGQTSAQYAQMLAGGGVTISNVTFIGNSSAQIGAFSNGATTNLGLNSGIVLSTGNATSAPGAGSNTFASTDEGEICTDADMISIAGSSNLHDPAILQFDFIPDGTTVTFQFVFASEEYPEFVDEGFNDAFGIFLSGPGIAGPYLNSAQNIALVPSTTTPISIDNVNEGGGICGLPLTGCTNCAYYIDNCSGTTISYNGFTTVITATYNVQCNQTYHLKFGLADATDGLYDSGVFIKGGSLSSGGASIDVTNSLGESGTVIDCHGSSITLDANILGTQTGSYSWSPGGQTDSSITVNPTSNKTYTVTYTYIDTSGCGDSGITVISDSINVVVAPTYKDTVNASVCQGSFYTLPNGGLASAAGTYTSNLTSSSGCDSVITTILTVMSPVTSTANATICQNDGYTLPDNSTVNTSGTYIDTVTSSYGCDSIITTNLTVNPSPNVTISSNSPICGNGHETLELNASGGNSYSWLGPNGFASSLENPTITNVDTTASGVYTVTVTNNNNNCSTQDGINVMVIPNDLVAPIINCSVSSQETVIFSWDSVAGADGYQVSLDDGNTWKSPNGGNGLSDQESATQETIMIRAIKNNSPCEFGPIGQSDQCNHEIVIPNVITPNGDGKNDVFKIKYISLYPNTGITVYDRWGRKVYQNDNYKNDWGGGNLKDGTYYYIITLSDKNKSVFKGYLTILNNK